MKRIEKIQELQLKDKIMYKEIEKNLQTPDNHFGCQHQFPARTKALLTKAIDRVPGL